QSSKRTPTCRICAQQPILRRYPTNTASSIFGGGLPVDRYPPPLQHFPGLPWALCIGFSGDGPSQTVLLRSSSPEIGTSRTSRDVQLESAKWSKADVGLGYEYAP